VYAEVLKSWLYGDDIVFTGQKVRSFGVLYLYQSVVPRVRKGYKKQTMDDFSLSRIICYSTGVVNVGE